MNIYIILCAGLFAHYLSIGVSLLLSQIIKKQKLEQRINMYAWRAL